MYVFKYSNMYGKDYSYWLNIDELWQYLFMISLHRRDGSCDINSDSSSRIYILNKTEDENLYLITYLSLFI